MQREKDGMKSLQDAVPENAFVFHRICEFFTPDRDKFCNSTKNMLISLDRELMGLMVRVLIKGPMTLVIGAGEWSYVRFWERAHTVAITATARMKVTGLLARLRED